MRSEGTAGSNRERGARASGRARRAEQPSDNYDLLTAALLGLAVGTAVTLLLRTGPKGRRPLGTALLAAGEGARRAAPYARKGAKWAGRHAMEGAEWARDRGEEIWDRVPAEEMLDEVGEYLANARDAINSAVSDELRDLRKAVKRRRKSLGI